MRGATIGLVLLAGILAACGTPKVAKDYEAKVYLPQEIETALRSEDPARRADAAAQVETMSPDQRGPILISLTTDERPHVRLMAVSLLGKHHADDASAIAALANVLSLDGDLDVRSAAVSALAAGTSAPSLTVLVETLSNDSSLVIKREAAAALDARTGQTFGKELADSIDTAEEAADEAMMAYEEWMENQGAMK